jgi:hypothetical protein
MAKLGLGKVAGFPAKTTTPRSWAINRRLLALGWENRLASVK